MTTRIAIKDFVEIFASETRIVLVEFVILTMMFVSKRDPHRVLFRTLLVKSRTSPDVNKTMIATLVNIATMMMANVDIDLVDGIEAAQVVNDVVVEIVFQSVIGDHHVANEDTYALNIAVTNDAEETMIAHRISSPVIVQLVVVSVMMIAMKLIAIDEGNFAKEIQLVLKNVEIPMIVPEA